MNQKDRQRIDLSCEKIAREVDMNILLFKLLENRIFNFDDCNISAWKENLNNNETKKHIVLCIKTRGPYAFKNFLTSLEQCGYNDLATNLSQLDIDSNIPTQERIDFEENATSSIIDTPYEENSNDYDSPNSFIYQEEPLQIVLKKSKSFLDVPMAGKKDLEKYIMRSKPRGLVLIVCIIEYRILESRESAKYDKVNLKKLFEEMGFDVTVTPEYLERKDLRKIIQNFAKRKEFLNVDSCFVIFSCHGIEAGKRWDAEVQTSEWSEHSQVQKEKLYCSEIIEYFSSTNCPSLKGKPKVFMFQMCRGDKHQFSVPFSKFATDGKPIYQSEEGNDDSIRGVEGNDNTNESDILHRNYEDTLIVHSTVPGHYSYRDTCTGAWFIQILCKVFMREAYHKHLKDLIDRVDQEVKRLRTEHKMCQTIITTSMGFYKLCYLNPGYFGDNK
ncbi:caspase Dronc [Leptopilina heterotoma]|uniref:caspase Dronc n=1 Tax=Leptopilina heterotoma TaxID=63436 RepID=UPI001CA7E8CA|nr:caspase Dronc [Leptopilina heterotoma]